LSAAAAKSEERAFVEGGLNAAGNNVAVFKQVTEKLNDPEKTPLGFLRSLL
jgi:hypothetical protein